MPSKATVEELEKTVFALSLKVEELEKEIEEKREIIKKQQQEIIELKKQLEEPEQLTVKTAPPKKDPLSKLTPAELLVYARREGYL